MERVELTEKEKDFISRRLDVNEASFKYSQGDIAYIIDTEKFTVEKIKILVGIHQKYPYSNYSFNLMYFVNLVDRINPNGWSLETRYIQQENIYESIEKAKLKLASEARYRLQHYFGRILEQEKEIVKVLKSYKNIDENMESEYFKPIFKDALNYIRTEHKVLNEFLKKIENKDEVIKFYKELG